MKKRQDRLRLSRETVRVLDANDLHKIKGGQGSHIIGWCSSLKPTGCECDPTPRCDATLTCTTCV